MAAMTMVSGNLLEQLDRSPNIMQDHESFRRATSNNYTLNEHDQFMSNESTPSTRSSLMERNPPLNLRQMGQAFSTLSMQESNMINQQSQFVSLEDSIRHQELGHLEDTHEGCARHLGIHASDSFTMSPEACTTDFSTPSEGCSTGNRYHCVDNNLLVESMRNKVRYDNPFVSTPPKFSRFSPNDSYASATSSVTSSHRKNGISQYQPMLYSAIGSFETLNNSSSYMRDITAKMISMKQTNQNTRLLIPPIRPQENLDSGSHVLLINNSEEDKSFPHEEAFPSSGEELMVREESLTDPDVEKKTY